jgi:hypothetical protein
MPNAENRMLPARTEPKVAAIHQEIDAMLFRCYGILVGDVDDLNIRHIQFETTRGTLLLTDIPGQ